MHLYHQLVMNNVPGPTHAQTYYYTNNKVINSHYSIISSWLLPCLVLCERVSVKGP